jgi:hypothetical protein
MFDVVTYALLKKKIEQAATGITGAEYKDGKLIFTLGDGNKLEVPLDISSGVAGALVNESGALVISFSDGTNLIYDVPTLIANALAPVENRLTQLESSQQELTQALENHVNDFDSLGLSVVDGLLCITYNEENDGNE